MEKATQSASHRGNSKIIDMKQLLIFSLLAVLSLSIGLPLVQSEPNSISGILTDKDSGDPIAFARIVLIDSLNQEQGASTDLDGKFKLNQLKPGTYSLEAHYVGYESLRKTGIKVFGQKGTELKLTLTSAQATLQEVTVTDYRDSRSRKQEAYSGAAYHHSTPYPQQSSYVDYNSMQTEGYAPINENGFKLAQASPLSTFSVDVDAASYANVRRYLVNGNKPPADAVRIEEMINYFDYDYPNPKDGHPFSITTEYGNCPWNSKHKLVHIGLQGVRIETDNLPPSNLVFLIDVSGSMNQANRLPLVKKSLAMLVDNLNPRDRVAIVVYAGAAGEVLPSTPASEKHKILEALERLQAGGSTAGGAGIKLAYDVALRNFMKDGNNRVIICTDGDFNVGASSDGEMQRLIEEKRKSGVFLTCLGYGMGNYKDSKLEILANKGNGNYAYIDNLLEAKKVLINEMGATLVTVAKDVKIQVEFNPAVVKSYRLVGYENRLLNNEDFNDDQKDAGEIGAGHSVTALYEIELVAGAESTGEPSVDPLKYQTTAATGNKSEILTVKFRYKEPNGSVSKLITKELPNTPIKGKQSDNFNWSAAVAMFGMYLRNSPYLKENNLGKMSELAASAKGKDPHGYRGELIRLISLSGALDSGKK
jgi:Ca-activated chloride channel homolog